MCICPWVQREKKCSGSPSIVAASMALTEGNGPYSNPLKDEGYKRFKCRETRGRKRQKEEAGEGWRGPILRLIESSFGTAGTSLKNEGVFRGNQKKGPLVVHTPSRRTESPESIFVLSQPQSTRAYLLKEEGHKFVIYDNCFLQKCKYIMTIISGGAHTSRGDVSSDESRKNCSSTMPLTPVK